MAVVVVVISVIPVIAWAMIAVTAPYVLLLMPLVVPLVLRLPVLTCQCQPVLVAPACCQSVGF